jgi:hypothetical protein
VTTPKLSTEGAARNTRDADIAIADREYRDACAKAWRARQRVVEDVRRVYHSKLADVRS